jgi:hypothetical protein
MGAEELSRKDFENALIQLTGQDRKPESWAQRVEFDSRW